MEPLVSVVIPIYNVDKKLFQSCIQSVLGQSYKNIEIVIVNDGSGENIYKYCCELSVQYPRIVVLSQENQGVSVARNNGTLKAKGDYILYVDADDVLAPISIEEGIHFILQYHVDVVVAGVQKIKDHDEFFARKKTRSNGYKILQSHEFDVLRRHYLANNYAEYFFAENGYINRGPYCRLMKKELARKNLFLGGLPIGEDLIWNMSLLNQSKTVCIVFNQWYGYLKNNGSAISKYYGNRKEKVERYLKILWKDNESFCEENINLFGKNMAIELYCILRYELMSERCSLTNGEKKKYVRRLLEEEPWNMLKIPRVKKELPVKIKVLLKLCSWGLWIVALKVLYGKDI